MADKITKIKLNGKNYDIDLPADAVPDINTLAVNSLTIKANQLENDIQANQAVRKDYVYGNFVTLTTDQVDHNVEHTTLSICGAKRFNAGATDKDNLATYEGDTILEKPTKIKVNNDTYNIDCEEGWTNLHKTTTVIGAQFKVVAKNGNAEKTLFEARGQNYNNPRTVFNQPLEVSLGIPAEFNGLIYAGGKELRMGGAGTTVDPMELNITDNTSDHNTIIKINKDFIDIFKPTTFKTIVNTDGYVYIGGREIRMGGNENTASDQYINFTDNTSNHNVILQLANGTITANKTFKTASNVPIEANGLLYAGGKEIRMGGAANNLNDQYINFTDNTSSHNVAMQITSGTITANVAIALEKGGYCYTVKDSDYGIINKLSLTTAITALTDTLTGSPNKGKTITAFDQVDGKVTATFEAISITESQISDFGSYVPTTRKINTKALSSNITLYGTDIAASSSISTKLIDSNGKIPTSLLPDSIVGQLEYKGTWNANSPAGVSSPETGWYYICTTAGDKNPANGTGTHYDIGDWAVYNGSSWDKVDNTDSVSSVFGRTGAVVLTSADVISALGFTPYDAANPNSYSSTVGTVTSITAGTGLSGGEITSSGTIALADAYGDTKNPYGTKAKNKVLAGPTSGSNAAPTFRSLVAADIPALAYLPDDTTYVATVNGASGTVSLGDTVGLKYLTTAPTTNNTDGTLKIVVLTSEPASRKTGYLYIITE